MLTIKNTLLTGLSLFGLYTLYNYIKDDYTQKFSNLRKKIDNTNKKNEELELKISQINIHLRELKQEQIFNEKQDYDWFVDIYTEEKPTATQSQIVEYKPHQPAKITKTGWFNLGIFSK